MSDSAFITKAGISVTPGQVWRDLDHRMGGREIIVKELGTHTFVGRVRIMSYRGGHETGPKRWLSVRRMHKHSTGFELVKGDA